MCFSPLWSGVFVNVIRYGKRMKILLYSVLFCLLRSKINPFSRIQFSRLLSRGKGKNIISFFLTSLTHQVESFLLLFFNILAVRLLNFK